MIVIQIEFQPFGTPIAGRRVGLWRLFVNPKVDREELIKASRELTRALETNAGVEYAELSDQRVFGSCQHDR